MSVAPLKAGTNILSAGPEKLIERCGEAVAAADRVLQAAKAGVRIKISGSGRYRQCSARGPRACLARDGRRGFAPNARLGEPHPRRGAVR